MCCAPHRNINEEKKSCSLCIFFVFVLDLLSPPFSFSFFLILTLFFLSFTLPDKDDSMFANQWFDKYMEKDSTVKEQTIRRQSLMVIGFNDSDEDADKYEQDIALGPIAE